MAASDVGRETVLDARVRRTGTVDELVAPGAGLAVLPVSVVRCSARAGVIHRPLPAGTG